MPIELVTGLPGSGKSLSAVDRMLKLRESDGSRPVFVLGVDGLKDGVAQAITPEDLQRWFEFPAGSIFVIDECQKYFPMRRTGDAPEWIKRLSEHRHLGHDFLLMTQAPGYIDTYVRGLVDHHTHIVRKFGTSICDRYEWPNVCMSPLARSERKLAVHKVWRYPRRCFALYKSAELHTVKRRIPAKFLLLPAAAAVVVAAVVLVPRVMRHGEHLSKPVAVASPAVAGSGSAAPSSSGSVRYATPAAYVAAFLPRVANAPWSAPAYDGDAIRAHPDLYCIEYEAPTPTGPQKLCSCYTEQVTPYDLHSIRECRRYARDGVYNPHRAPLVARNRGSSRGGDGDQPHEGGTASARSAGDESPGGWPQAGSAIHTDYVPPERSRVRSLGGGVGGSGPLR